MNKLIFSITSLGMFFFLLFNCSCDFKKNDSDNLIRLDTLQLDKTYSIDNKSDLPSCNIKIKFIYPKSSDSNSCDTIQSFFIEKVLGETFKKENPKSAVDNFVNHYIHNFKLFIENMSDENSENENLYEDETGFSYYIQLQDSITYNKNGFISFTVETISYEGGAHSSKNIYGYVFNLNTKEMITENDFAVTNYEKGMSVLITEKIAESFNTKDIKELENLGFYSIEDIKPNNNFTLNEDGITYYYNSNEIAGSMVGIIKVFISYPELAFFLQNDSPISPLIPF